MILKFWIVISWYWYNKMAASGAENAVEEDAADLVFPPEFEKADTKTLLISEVHILLEHRKQVKYKLILD